MLPVENLRYSIREIEYLRIREGRAGQLFLWLSAIMNARDNNLLFLS